MYYNNKTKIFKINKKIKFYLKVVKNTLINS